MSLDAIGIVSKDLTESVDFYGQLGVELKPVGGPDHLEGKTPSGVRIMVDSESLMKQLNATWQRGTGTSIVLCFKQNSPENVDALFDRLKGGGRDVVKEPWDAFWGQRYCSVKDPDGNQIDIFADL